MNLLNLMTNSRQAIRTLADAAASILLSVILTLSYLACPSAVNARSADSPDLVPPPTTAGQLIISEFRLRGPAGANDEFIELYNTTGAPLTTQSADLSSGLAVASSDGIVRCLIGNGTFIPAYGHLLCTNAAAYSLSANAPPNLAYALDIPDNAGIALFNNSTGGGAFTASTRLDAVGSTSETNALYREGTGYAAVTPYSIEYSICRRYDPKTGLPVDTNNNEADLRFSDTNAIIAATGVQRLGAPGPEGTYSSIFGGANTIAADFVDPACTGRGPSTSVCGIYLNRTADPANNSTFGTLTIRRRITNNSGAAVTRLRFRITNIDTFPAPTGSADLRVRSSNSTTALYPNGNVASLKGLTLEEPPSQQNGGGFNSSLSAGMITLGTPLADGSSINVNFSFGIQQNGSYNIGFAIGALPTGGSYFLVSGNTSLTPGTIDFDGDSKTDLSIYRPQAGEWWWLNSGDGTSGATPFGSGTDKLVPADYTGDGRTDLGFWRPSTGEWYIVRSENYTYYSFPFGSPGDIPAPGDFDADGRADAAVFRGSTATWYINKSSGGITTQQFGLNGDIPVVSDYDGDGKADLAIFRGANAQWWLQRSTSGTVAFQFGLAGDLKVPGDYTGDGKADIAFYRPSTGQWFVLRSENQSYYSVPFGAAGDMPAPGDYDGDGKFEPAVFRSSTSTWYANRPAPSSVLIQQFGQTGDVPVPGAFVR